MPPRVKPHLRLATAVDAPRVAELAAHLGSATSLEIVRERIVLLRGDDHALSLAVLPTEGVVGWVETRLEQSILTGRRCRVTGLVVSPETQGVGVGRALLAAAEAWARAHGCQEIYLTTDVQGDEAHAFYEALGWERRTTSHVYARTVLPAPPPP